MKNNSIVTAIFISFDYLFICFTVSVLAWKSQDSKFSAECAQLFLSQCWLVLPLSICYSDSKPNSGSENENGFYVWSNNLNGFLFLSLSPLSEPGAVYRPVSNYSLVNTETEAWKTVFCIYCSRPALLSKRMLLPPPPFLSHSLPLQQDFFFFFFYISLTPQG